MCACGGKREERERERETSYNRTTFGCLTNFIVATSRLICKSMQKASKYFDKS